MQLRYVPAGELERLRALEDPDERIAALADACRINTLYMIKRAGSGHIGTSFSAMEILVLLHAELLRPGDRAFSSKGHDAPGTYAVLAATGTIALDRIHTLRRLGGLPGHPDVVAMPEMVTSTGSLGMGVSKARGFVLADRMAGRSGRVYVITGDGELQEGQFWESLQPTANRGLHEITVIVDHNKLQSDTWVSQVSDLGDLEAKAAAFGWAVARCDGHDVGALRATLASLHAEDRPQLLIADTVKGRGVSFMEPRELPVAGDALYGFHSGAPSDEDYENGVAQLHARLGTVTLADAPPADPPPAPPARPQRLVAAYGEALAQAGARRADLVAMDGDLYLDTGLIAFRAAHPDRYLECGIAEQDMVSQAGAMALAGLLPAVHSFACFLAPRADEQIYNNASEGTKVLYAGSLAGIVPGGPGHSHQSVRDIAIFGSVTGMALIEPFCEAEATSAVAWAVDEATGPVYIRLVSVPWDLGFEVPALTFVAGRGNVLRPGSDVMFVTTGPVMVSQAWAAADLLAAEGTSAGVIALPWLRGVDGAWLADAVGGAAVVTIDNHALDGGQGAALPATLRLGIDRVPACGRNDEVLRAHGLDAAGIAEAVRAL